MGNIIDSIKEEIIDLKEIKLKDISDNLEEDTALIVVDMINGLRDVYYEKENSI